MGVAAAGGSRGGWLVGWLAGWLGLGLGSLGALWGCAPGAGSVPGAASPAPPDGGPGAPPEDRRFGLFSIGADKEPLAALGVRTTRHVLLMSRLRALVADPRAQEVEVVASLIPRGGPWENGAVRALVAQGLVGSGPLLGRCGFPDDMEAYAAELAALLEKIDGDGIGDAPGLRFPVTTLGLLNEPHLEWLGRMTAADLAGIGSLEDLQRWREDHRAELEESLWAFIVQTAAVVRAVKPEIRLAVNLPVILEGLPAADRARALQALDVVDLHFYGDHLGLDARLEEVQARAAALGFSDKPLWSFELGGPLQETPFSSEAALAAHADEVIKLHLVALSHGVGRIYYVSLVPIGGYDSPRFHNLSLLTEGGAPKPAFFAYQALLQRVMGFERVVRLASGRFHFRVERAGRGSVWVLWEGAGGGLVDLSAEVDRPQVTVSRVVGEGVQVEVAPREAVRVGPRPVFVE